MKNRYFLVKIPNVNLAKIYDLIVGGKDGVRILNDKKSAIIKLPAGDDKQHGILNNAEELTAERVQEINNIEDENAEGLLE